MLKQKSSLISFLAFLGVLNVSSIAVAGPFKGVSGTPGTEDIVAFPQEVPGKEYSNYLDRQGHPNQSVLTPGQVVDWDANPLTPDPWGTKNGTNFLNLWNPTTGENPPDPFEIDALANKQDFWGHVLLFSTGETGITGLDTLLDDHILYEKKSGAWGIWAYPDESLGTPVIDQIRPDDVDALEVWAPIDPNVPLEDRVNQGVGQFGFEGVPDANRYSLAGDPLGSSIFNSVGNCLVNTTQIASAINAMDYFGFLLNPEDIDLDALLFYENPVKTYIGPGQSIFANIEFSLAPIDGDRDGKITLDNPNLDLDGGEIFVWNFDDSRAHFLYQGGHLWDTEFSVKGKFGTGSENVNALERVAKTPEPSSIIGLMSLGILAAGSNLKRKLKLSHSTEKEPANVG